MRSRIGLVAVVGVGLLACAAPADASHGLQLGLTDGVYESSDPVTRDLWLNRTVDARSDLVILGAPWGSIAPGTRPSGFNPRNPGDPAYSWGTLDAAVRDAHARGLKVMLLVTGGAPSWAEGPHRPASAPTGTWKPRPKKLADFAHAIATRYSGHFADPAMPARNLPRVRYWQLWAEANLSIYLTPQWSHGHPASPKHYRSMLNAFYGAVKGVHHSNKVVTSGLAPYGDVRNGDRLPPVLFWRGLLCLRGKALDRAPCKHPAHFDIAAHNPINVGRPTRHARNPNDVSTPDLGRIKHVLRKARHTGRVRPKGRKPLWATEIWWDSDPPDPFGVPERQHARWLELSFYILWKQGASAVVWFQIRDEAPSPDYASTYQTGLYFRDGQPKLALHAYRFPFVADRLSNRSVRVWGEAPRRGAVAVQRKGKSGWRTVARAHASGNRVFVHALHLPGKARLRAKQRGQTSLEWRQD